jgi:glycosyltransferase involved in cell wall biosynthesis
MFRDEAPYLVEWIEYHLLVGVEHFWLYDHLSTDDSLAVLASYVARGVVTVVPWPHPHRPGDISVRQRTQVAACRDGLRRASGEVGWVAVIDVDEFLLPMYGATVPRCLGACFPDASGVYANWRSFGTSGVTVAPGEPLLSRLTACSLPSHPENRVGKSVVRPDKVVVDDAWYVHHFPIDPGARYFDGRGIELSHDERHDLRLAAPCATDGYLRVNHYNLRDEGYYRSRRLAEARRGYLNKSLGRLLEHHRAFGVTRDTAILDFLERHHRAAYDRIWASSRDRAREDRGQGVRGRRRGGWRDAVHGSRIESTESTVHSTLTSSPAVGQDPMMVAPSPSVTLTIVFSSGRRQPRLDWLLDGIERQATDADAIELIVVDLHGRSAAELGYRDVPGVVRAVFTEPMPTPWQGRHRVFTHDWWAASNARNTGIALCGAEYVAFLDDRQHLGADWLATVRRGASERDAVLAGSYDLYDDPAGVGVSPDHRRLLAPEGRVDCGGAWLYGGSFAAPLAWLLEANGFEHGMDGISGEDCVLGLMLTNLGHRVDFVPAMYSWKERPAGSEHGLLVLGEPDLSHRHRAAIERFGGRSRTEFTPDLRALRDVLAAGGDFPGVDPDESIFDWYAGRLILLEFDARGVPYRTRGYATVGRP